MTSSATRTRPYDAVLCDLDNVIRFYDTAALSALESAAGLPAGTTARVAFTPQIDHPLLLGRVTKAQWTGSVAAALSDRVPPARAEELARALAYAPFRADPAVVRLLRRVRAEVPLVLVTNADLDLGRDLASLGLADLPHHVVSSAEVGVAKPDPAIYALAADRAAARPERCVFVDDRAENVDAAVALGMTGVLYRDVADLDRALGLD